MFPEKERKITKEKNHPCERESRPKSPSAQSGAKENGRGKEYYNVRIIILKETPYPVVSGRSNLLLL